MRIRSGYPAAVFLALAGLCSARSFDVISTNTGGVEVVMVPVSEGTLLLQFRGQAIYIDPGSSGTYTGLPKADFVFFTAGARSAGVPVALRKPATVIVTSPLSEKQAFGPFMAQAAGGGFVFEMGGRRIYVSGAQPPAAIEAPDVAFLCFSAKCAPDPADAIGTTSARLVFPYRFGRRDLKALKSTPRTEIRLRRWNQKQ